MCEQSSLKFGIQEQVWAALPPGPGSIPGPLASAHPKKKYERCHEMETETLQNDVFTKKNQTFVGFPSRTASVAAGVVYAKRFGSKSSIKLPEGSISKI